MSKYLKKSKRKSKKRSPKLGIQLTPISTSGINCRTEFPEAWEFVRKQVYKRAGHRCEICGARNKGLHCHEIFKFNLRDKKQVLTGFLCVCILCHNVIHMGRTQRVGNSKQALEHLCKVNNWSKRRAVNNMDKVFLNYRKHLKHQKWEVDLSYIDTFLQQNIEGF